MGVVVVRVTVCMCRPTSMYQMYSGPPRMCVGSGVGAGGVLQNNRNILHPNQADLGTNVAWEWSWWALQVCRYGTQMGMPRRSLTAVTDALPSSPQDSHAPRLLPVTCLRYHHAHRIFLPLERATGAYVEALSGGAVVSITLVTTRAYVKIAVAWFWRPLPTTTHPHLAAEGCGGGRLAPPAPPSSTPRLSPTGRGSQSPSHHPLGQWQRVPRLARHSSW